ncbi:unnamed protein product [Dibothriocephalus latus]|uniref:Uncharacterized protein n=1 Tax=Dibothriocephalus latus TaxID=60516 RepID=A0A3P6PRM0_DIBLA|nr:unnamed protein product [Dibothriocephalus latus]
MAWFEQGCQSLGPAVPELPTDQGPPGTFPSPNARFSHVHLDVVGPGGRRKFSVSVSPDGDRSDRDITC